MQKRIVISILGLASLACGQNIPGGAINGKALPERIFQTDNRNLCGNLHKAIRDSARDQLAKDTNLQVTPEDIAAAKATVQPSDASAMSEFMVKQETMMVAALTAVDAGQDPQQVYKTMLQPKGVDPIVWASYQRQWKDQKGHRTILGRLAMTPEKVAKSLAAYDWEPMARKIKLDNLVDQELASKDGTFRTALEHWNAGHGLPSSEKQYLDQQREKYWKGQEAKLTVTLNDPTLAARCGLVATK